MKSAVSPELFLLNFNDCTSKEAISLCQCYINNISCSFGAQCSTAYRIRNRAPERPTALIEASEKEVMCSGGPRRITRNTWFGHD